MKIVSKQIADGDERGTVGSFLNLYKLTVKEMVFEHIVLRLALKTTHLCGMSNRR